MAKPWEETWTVVEIPKPSGIAADWPTEYQVESEHVPMLDMSDLAHATLQAAAPELVRALLAVEWGGEFRRVSNAVGVMCPACHARPDQHGKVHKPTCLIDAALRKAGVR